MDRNGRQGRFRSAERIPADILQYARDRFPGCEVQAAKRDGKNTEIKLSNRTELMFNAKGEPIDREKEPRDD